MDDSTKTIVKVLALVGGGIALYWWLKQSGYWAQWFGPTMPAGMPLQPIQPPVQTQAPAQPPASTTSGLPANYSQAASVMTTAAGAQTQNFDQWSWWWQNGQSFSGAPAGFGSNGSISGTLIDAMIAAGGGDRSAMITAQQWVNLLWTKQQAGVSGLQGFALPMTPQYGWLN